jgi:hypothetical protein
LASEAKPGIAAFVLEQSILDLQPSRKAGQFAIGPEQSMAGWDDRGPQRHSPPEN